MSRQKLKKFEENKSRDNVIEDGKPFYNSIKGNWNSDFFKNSNEITLELACGRGEYSIGMSQKFPERNFVGVDLKGDRLWKGSGVAIDQKQENVGFLRTDILLLENFFDQQEVNEIWVVFPDPRPRKRDAKRRLMHDRYLDVYKKVIKPGGVVRLKTDNTDFFEYALEVLKERTDITGLIHTFDVYESEYRPECHEITTRYEAKFSQEGHKIKYLRFSFL